jgi:alpha-L-glutamate ligase-like protein
MWQWLRANKAILGMNARNLEYIRPYNKIKAREIADQKLLCKKRLKKAGIPTSPVMAQIATVAELDNFDWSTLPESFALKPNRGFGGEGILVVYGRKKNTPDTWVKADGSTISVADIRTHIQNILDGTYSLANTPDVAFFETRLKLLKLFKPYSYKGIPDIRVIVFNRVPVMAMLRLPTRESGGKANLHQGALGLGIDMASGVTTSAVNGFGNFVDNLPGSELPLSGIRIPYWRQILTLAVQAQEVTNLGYLGVDVAIDRDLGPVILELNARPGLAIQLANRAGLKERLERVKGVKIKNADHGVRVGRNLFGGEIEEEVEELTGKKVLGTTVKVKLTGKDGKQVEVEAKVDTGAETSAIDRTLAAELGFSPLLEFFDSLPPTEAPKNREEADALEAILTSRHGNQHPDLAELAFVHATNGVTLRPKIYLDMEVDGVQLERYRATIADRSNLQYRMILGKNCLPKFLVDVTKL